MARNVEIKARIPGIASLLPAVTALATSDPTRIAQDDTFFTCPNGRLKLRVFPDQTGELIFYRRPDGTAPRESFYVRTPTAAPDSLRETLTLAYGQTGRVRKDRTLFLIDRTRVHLDRVEGLGDFLELEVVLEPTEATKTGLATANSLLHTLGIAPEQLVATAYVDMLEQAGMSPTARGAAPGPLDRNGKSAARISRSRWRFPPAFGRGKTPPRMG